VVHDQNGQLSSKAIYRKMWLMKTMCHEFNPMCHKNSSSMYHKFHVTWQEFGYLSEVLMHAYMAWHVYLLTVTSHPTNNPFDCTKDFSI
jgi:hypothetical protein